MRSGSNERVSYSFVIIFLSLSKLVHATPPFSLSCLAYLLLRITFLSLSRPPSFFFILYTPVCSQA